MYVFRGDRAICYFLRALEIIDSTEIVDTLLLPDDDAHKRKLSRLSQGQLRNYIKERKRKRDLYILEDEQRQIARLQHSHMELFRLYMQHQFRDVSAAHRHLLESFRLCDQLVHEELIAESPDLESLSVGNICDWRGHNDDANHSSRYKYGAIKEESTTNINIVKTKTRPQKSSKKHIQSSKDPKVVSSSPKSATPPNARILGDGWKVRNNALRFAHNILKTYVVSIKNYNFT